MVTYISNLVGDILSYFMNTYQIRFDEFPILLMHFAFYLNKSFQSCFDLIPLLPHSQLQLSRDKMI